MAVMARRIGGCVVGVCEVLGVRMRASSDQMEPRSEGRSEEG